jgi:hypothetical protein
MLYAHDAKDSDGSMMGRSGMMGMMDGMRNMMHGKDGMMEGCPMMRRMRGDHPERPNEQWREKEQSEPEEKG